MMKEEFKEFVKSSPPKRVLINFEGVGVPWVISFKMGIKVDVVYVRDDYWTLGVSYELEDVARSLYDTWIARVDTNTWEIETYG